MGVLKVNVRTTLTALWLLLPPRAQRTLYQDQPLTSYPLHLHAPRLDAALGQALLGDDAADMVREDEGGLEDGEGFGVGAGCRLVDGDIQGTAVIFHTSHLHVLQGEGVKKNGSLGSGRGHLLRSCGIHVSSTRGPSAPNFDFAFARKETISLSRTVKDGHKPDQA